MYHNETAGAYIFDTLSISIPQKSLEDIEKRNYFILLMDGRTDSSVTKQELICFVFMQ